LTEHQTTIEAVDPPQQSAGLKIVNFREFEQLVPHQDKIIELSPQNGSSDFDYIS
jgi:hypothetical protein